MASSWHVVETVILHRKADSNVVGPKDSQAVQTFARLTQILNSQKGCIGQHWGYGVEDPDVFVWINEWEKIEDHEAFMNTAVYKPFLGDVGELFDLEKGAPIQTFVRLDSEATKACKSPVTEVAFFTLKTGGRKAKDSFDEAMKPTEGYVKTYGKARGAASDWVFKMIPPNEKLMPRDGGLLYGIFGYDSIDDHMSWRETPQHAEIVKAGSKLDEKGVHLEAAAIPGIHPETGWFHVHFRSEI